MVLTYKNKFNKKYKFKPDEPHTLEEISKLTNYKLDGLKIIYSKGMGAYFSNPSSVRKNVKSPEQWGMGRIYSAVMNGKSSVIDASHLIVDKTKK